MILGRLSHVCSAQAALQRLPRDVERAEVREAGRRGQLRAA